MATIRSLGVHRPTAIPYLVAESILPPDPTDDQFSWQTYSTNDENDGLAEEEIVFTDTCVVWCRGGVVRRSFRFDIEKENVVQALFANFPALDRRKRNSKKYKGSPNEDGAVRKRPTTPDPELKVRSKGKKRQQVTIKETDGDARISDTVTGDEEGGNGTSRAMVVVLKSQAHIFFLSGDSHIIPLPFEVDSAWPMPHGLLFQRKIDEKPINHAPSAPPNSFVSSQTTRPLGRSSNSFTLSGGSGNRPSLTISPAQPSKWRMGQEKDVSLPRVFSLLDPHSEMGLVVSDSPDHGSTRTWDALSPDEEILYVSHTNEIPKEMILDTEAPPLILVVTLNENQGTYTVWTARNIDKDTDLSKRKRRVSSMSGAHSKRRSSYFDAATGITTPVGRGPGGMRESFGMLTHSRNVSNMSHQLGSTQPNNDSQPGEAEDLESQLGREFGDIGAPLKTSRRVSSLLARADLAANNDRATFSELATGSQAGASMHGGHRGRESFGGQSMRGSFGFRNSLPAGNASIYSNASSFLDAPVDKLLESLDNGGDFEGFDSMGLKETVSGLPREMALTKVQSFSSGFSSTRGIPTSAKRRKFGVFSVSSFQGLSAEEKETAQVALCILNRNSRTLTVANICIQGSKGAGLSKPYSRKNKKKSEIDDGGVIARCAEIHRGDNVIDCCKLIDGEVSRILVLSSTSDGLGELTLQAPWSTVVKVELPSIMAVYEPYSISLSTSPDRPREGSLRRVLEKTPLNLSGLPHSTNRGKVDVVDNQGKNHRIQVQLEPRNPLVRRSLAICKFVLQRLEKASDGILVSWWEVLKWLRSRDETAGDMEWSALVITLFTMAVYFIEDKPAGQKAPQKRKKKGFLRSSSGSSIDLTDWNSMLDHESGCAGVDSPWMTGPAWGWISEEAQRADEGARKGGKHRDTLADDTQTGLRKNGYIRYCAGLAREFLASPQGEAASGSDGYLPTAMSRDRETRRTALGTILVGLHLLREEQKLSTVDAESSHAEAGILAPVLAQIGGWLGWATWGWGANGYYALETASMDRWLFEESSISTLDVPLEPFAPPSIFSFVESAQRDETSKFLTIVDVVSGSRSPAGTGHIWEHARKLTPKTLALTGLISEFKQKSLQSQKVELLGSWGLTSTLIDSFPDGVSAPLQEAIARCQASPPVSWGSSLLELVDRNDVFLSITNDNIHAPMSKAPISQNHDALRDVYHIGNSTLDFNAVNSFEVSAEADRQSITRLIFRDDRRYFDAARILNQMKAAVAECSPEPEWTESDLLEAQKELVQLVCLRTLSVPAGRGMIGYSGRVPLLTEKLPIPSFSLQCIMKPSNVTISADRTAFTEDKVCWAFFHNGASTGLAISKAAKGIDTSWILYNKPQELTNRHAGFLLALGLNGHLKSLAKWVAFKYLTPKHTMTSVGLLLGLSVSYLGTMDTLITRLLSVHVTRMLPPGAAELNLSTLTQTTGIMGIGLLYCNSQHRRMSEIMLSEIENLEQEEPSASHEILRDEGYRLAAGFALGFINLAKGRDMRGLRDMHVVERLLTLAVGTKNVDMVHILDRATAGATIALAIMFMKSNDTTIAEKIDVPDTLVQFDYVRPDIFLLRTLAKHLIMWDSINPSIDWVQKNLPRFYKRKVRLTTVTRLNTDDMPFFNIVAGLCFAIGLRFAGSAFTPARDLLVSYLDQFIRICRLPVVNYDGRLARNSARNCQDIVALSAAAVMAGTGDLVVFRRLRSLHGRVDGEVPYGSHMAAHMAIGMLFLGGGTYTLGTSDLGIAALLCSFYPVFPTTVLDNKCHLQAFRHLWVLAAEPRCLVPRDLDTRRAVTIPISLALKTGDVRAMTAPCLLPNLADIKTVRIESPDHWDLTLDFAGNEKLRDKFRSGDQSVYLRRRAAYDSSGSSVFSSALMALSDAQDIAASSSIPGYTKTANSTAVASAPILYSQGKSSVQVRFPPRHLWEWIFSLKSFRRLDIGEKALVVPSAPFQQPLVLFGKDQSRRTIGSLSWLQSTIVDTRLALEKTVHDLLAAAAGQAAGEDMIRDRLWQLKLLIGWVDATRPDEEDDTGSKGMWLRQDIIEDIRWKIWGVQAGDEGLASR